MRSIRQNEIDACKNAIDGEKSSQVDAASWSDIIAAKKEAVGLQLEAAYRARLVEAHSQASANIKLTQEVNITTLFSGQKAS